MGGGKIVWGPKKPKAGTRLPPLRCLAWSTLLLLPLASAGVRSSFWGCWKAGCSGPVDLKVAPCAVETPQLLPVRVVSAGGAKLDRNFQQRGLAETSAGWRAGFLRREEILRFQYCSLIHFWGTNPRAFSKLQGKLRRESSCPRGRPGCCWGAGDGCLFRFPGREMNLDFPYPGGGRHHPFLPFFLP